MVTKTILHALTVLSEVSCTGTPADGADILLKKLGSMMNQSKMTVRLVAPEVTTQIPALKVWFNSRLKGLFRAEGSVMTPAAPDPGVPEHEPDATLKSFTVALATPVPISMRRRMPADPFTVVVVAVVMLAPDDPDKTRRPDVSVRRE